MARMPNPRPARAPRTTSPTILFAGLRRVAAGLAACCVVAATLPGCAGGGSAFGPGDPLTPQADCARRSAPVPAPVPREFAKTLLPTYRFAPGDTVLVEAARFDAPLRFPADQTVQPDGTIDLGRFGRPAVAGMSVEEVEALVARRVDFVLEQTPIGADGAELDLAELREDGLLEVNVRLIDPAGSVYYVLGAVAAPGVYPLAGRETVLDAILTAGGLADNAKRCDIVLSRPSVPHDCRTVLPVCYDNLVQTGDSATNYQVLPGDRIFVPARGCKDAMAGLFGCDRGCELCRCAPQFPCGPDVKPCPTPVRYAAACQDPAGVSAVDFLSVDPTVGPTGLPRAGEPDAVPAPAPVPSADGEGRSDGDAREPAPAPPRLRSDSDAGDTDSALDPADDAPADDAPAGDGEQVTPDPAAVPDVPDVPDLPQLDDLSARSAVPRFRPYPAASPAASPAGGIVRVSATAKAPATGAPAVVRATGDLPTLSADGL